ncbi:MAG: nuclear transport factor 2 family protein [Gemmatimonadota bacterium]
MADRTWYDGILQAVDAKDSDAFSAHLTDDATFKWGAQDAVQGNAAVKDYVDAFLAMFDGTRHTLEEILEDGATRICRGTVTYLTKDGREVPTPFCNVFHMEGDKIRDYLVYADPSPLTPAA